MLCNRRVQPWRVFLVGLCNLKFRGTFPGRPAGHYEYCFFYEHIYLLNS